jgi:metallo-beta-lactamase family protein
MATLSFWGAAKNVTGSRYLVRSGASRILIDAGLYQEREFRHRNWERFPEDPGLLSAVVLTHGHVDHCGYLPRLVRDGFRGPVWCTPATAGIARIVLLDSARLQEEDAERKKARHEREGRRGPFPEESLYTVADVDRVIPLFKTVCYGVPFTAAEGIRVEFRDAGHILGSSSVRVEVGLEGGRRTVVAFSGDLGRTDTPILRDPQPIPDADVVVVESTYGDRVHKDIHMIQAALSEAVKEAARAGGRIIIPSFAVERSQDLLYRLRELLDKRLIPAIPVFLDSPMAVRITELFSRHAELFDEAAQAVIRQGDHPCDFPGLKLCRSREESASIATQHGGAIIIAGSGMCTGGRIKDHLAREIANPASMVLFVGYQASGTLGRQILDGDPEVRIHNEVHTVRAKVRRINGFSAHAGQDELLKWLMARKDIPRHVFVTHGEPKTAAVFADAVKAHAGWAASVPDYGDTEELG